MRIAKIRLAITAFSNTGIRIKGRGGLKVTGEVSQKEIPVDFGRGSSSFKKARLSYSSVHKSLVATFANTIVWIGMENRKMKKTEWTDMEEGGVRKIAWIREINEILIKGDFVAMINEIAFSLSGDGKRGKGRMRISAARPQD